MDMDTKSPKLTLYRGFPPSNQYTWSPFVTKLEFRLRVAGIAYQNQEGNPREGPSGKVPYVDISALSDQPKGEKEFVGDSKIIIQTLVRRGATRDLDEDLDAPGKLAGLSIQALFEEKLYFLQVSVALKRAYLNTFLSNGSFLCMSFS